MSDTILAWHFIGDTLRYGSPVPPDGQWLEWTGPLVICKSGLHASIDPFDALQYAPGPMLCRVECGGQIIQGDDKLVCSQRRIIERRDTTEGLQYFARMQALSVAHLWDIPDVVLAYLLSGDEDIRAAAWAAAWDATRDAARAAARAAAWAAARDAAWVAAKDAARAAAWAAACDDAKAAAWAAARGDWNILVREAFELDNPSKKG